MEKEINFKKDNFIFITKDSLTDYYKIIRIIGQGGYGKVYEVQNLKTSRYYACKKVSKINILNYDKFKSEISIMLKADHPNIVKLYEIYESIKSLYLIMEICRGGPLFQKITERAQEKNMYSEKDAANIFTQIMSAIEYCHIKGIYHRDLKPENILYLNEVENEEKNSLKIINFIFSKHFKINKLSSKIGSIYYIAPEVLTKSYTEKCDIWSAGVLLFLLLSGTLPFNDKEYNQILGKIKACKYNMNNKIWNNISNEAKDLIKHMLVPENERFSAKQVLEHPWFKYVNKIKNKKINIKLDVFKKYSEENTLKKIILYFIATRLNEKEIEELNVLFKKFDKDFDGQINYREFENSFTEYQKKNYIFNEKEIKHFFNLIDINKNGKINYSEFISASIAGRKDIIERRLLDAFAHFDKNQTGKIKKEDLIKALHVDISLKEKGVETILNELSDNELVDYNQFLNSLRNKI